MIPPQVVGSLPNLTHFVGVSTRGGFDFDLFQETPATSTSVASNFLEKDFISFDEWDIGGGKWWGRVRSVFGFSRARASGRR